MCCSLDKGKALDADHCVDALLCAIKYFTPYSSALSVLSSPHITLSSENIYTKKKNVFQHLNNNKKVAFNYSTCLSLKIWIGFIVNSFTEL